MTAHGLFEITGAEAELRLKMANQKPPEESSEDTEEDEESEEN